MPWRGCVRLQKRIVCVGGDQPDLAILEIREELGILFGAELSGPQNFGAVDLSSIKYPFVVNVVIFLIAHHDEVLAGSVVQSISNGGAARIALAGPLKRIASVPR